MNHNLLPVRAGNIHRISGTGCSRERPSLLRRRRRSRTLKEIVIVVVTRRMGDFHDGRGRVDRGSRHGGRDRSLGQGRGSSGLHRSAGAIRNRNAFPLESSCDHRHLHFVAHAIAHHDAEVLMHNQVQENPAAICDVLGRKISPDLEALIMKCLRKTPGDRPASAEVLDVALSHCVSAGTWTVEDAELWWRDNAGSIESTPITAMPEKTLVIAPR